MIDALIEIAVRNGPMRYQDWRSNPDGEEILIDVEWDPAAECAGSHYPPFQRARHDDDYCTAARALGIL
jgi:hypothetical protein